MPLTLPEKSLFAGLYRLRNVMRSVMKLLLIDVTDALM